MEPTITVLMSVYNDERYLRQSIESILKQTYREFEFLIFDDASTDGSKNILKEYMGKDNRIKVIFNKENKGLSHNLAEGVKLANGNWVARMDADDIAFKDRLWNQINYIKQNPDVDVLGGYVVDIDEFDNEIEVRKVPANHEDIKKLIWTCPFIHPTVMFRKSAIIKVGSYNSELRRRQDYDLWFRCSAADLKFANLTTPLIYYRTTNDYYKKNNIRVQFNQFIIGIKGSLLVKARPIAFLGITLNFIKGILPLKLKRLVTQLFKKYDPRRKSI